MNVLPLLSISEAQRQLRDQVKAKRLQRNLTQAGLARRSGVSLGTLRKFEQEGAISLESFLKLLAVTGGLNEITKALEIDDEVFDSIDDVLKGKLSKPRKYGRRG